MANVVQCKTEEDMPYVFIEELLRLPDRFTSCPSANMIHAADDEWTVPYPDIDPRMPADDRRALRSLQLCAVRACANEQVEDYYGTRAVSDDAQYSNLTDQLAQLEDRNLYEGNQDRNSVGHPEKFVAYQDNVSNYMDRQKYGSDGDY